MPLHLRLMADDLTGALDSAAAFAASGKPVPVLWRDAIALPEGPLAFDTGTREPDGRRPGDRVHRLAPRLFRNPADLAFKKIDSLLRGAEAAEIAAILAARPFRYAVVAPAFPGQGRTTRGGRQGVVRPDGGWMALDTDLAADLAALGRPATPIRAGDPLPDGVSLADAETDEDLDRVVSAASDPTDVLWIGSAGLAMALSRRFLPDRETDRVVLARPILGLFGSHHAVMEGQLAMVERHRVTLRGPSDALLVPARLAERGVCLVTASVPVGATRTAASDHIAAAFRDLVRHLAPPGALIAAGGETLRMIADALNVEALAVGGEVSPGIPCSVVRGGAWDGTCVISKSGAFGAPDILSELLDEAPAHLSGASHP